ncbi:sodium:solute symporter family protein [Candidatus Bathyarchaeota archaeon]|nr:MAG: sodium:solute symporter family protein [Candidatus Bathyarchaeota archaeon]
MLLLVHYGRLKTGKGVEEYYIAGRNITGLVAALTYAATTYSVFMMVGLVGLTYAYGVGALGFELTYLLATVLLLTLFAPRFWVAGRKWKYVTPTQLLADRYQSRTVGIVTTVLCLVFLVPYMAIQGMGSAYLLEALSGGAVSYTVGLTFIVVVIAFCALWGGFRGVAWTDVVLGLVMLGSSLYLMFYLASTYLGGWLGFVQTLETNHASFLSVPGPGFFTFPKFLELTVPWFFFALTNPQVSQRLFVPKSVGSMKVMILGFFVFGFIYTVTTVTLGLMGRALGILAYPADKVMPIILGTFVPTPLALIIMLGILSAGVTTANSIILTLGSMVGRDFYGSLAKKPSEKTEIRIGYLVIIVEAMLIWIFAFQRLGLISLLAVMASGGLLVQLPTILGAFCWKKATAPAAYTSILIGGVATGIFYIFKFSFLSLGPPILGLILTTIVFILVSLLTKPPSNAEIFLEEIQKELKERNFL